MSDQSPLQAPRQPLEVDVAVVGGGMVGASLAAGLIGTGVRLLLVEAVPFGASTQPSFDERTTALGNASRRIFEGLGVWSAIAPVAAPIRAIHVSDAGRFGSARLVAEEQGVDALGYVVSTDRSARHSGAASHGPRSSRSVSPGRSRTWRSMAPACVSMSRARDGARR